jgi:ATP-dependent protease ClpP protease subunit
MYILFGESRCSEEGGAMEKKGVMVIAKDKMYSMNAEEAIAFGLCDEVVSRIA